MTQPELAKILEDARELGFSAEQQAAIAAKFASKVGDDVFQVHPDNHTAVRLFRAMGTQWRMLTVSTLGAAKVVRTGLIYEALPTIERSLGITADPADFTRLQIMEAEALTAWSEQRD